MEWTLSQKLIKWIEKITPCRVDYSTHNQSYSADDKCFISRLSEQLVQLYYMCSEHCILWYLTRTVQIWLNQYLLCLRYNTEIKIFCEIELIRARISSVSIYWFFWRNITRTHNKKMIINNEEDKTRFYNDSLKIHWFFFILCRWKFKYAWNKDDPFTSCCNIRPKLSIDPLKRDSWCEN